MAHLEPRDRDDIKGLEPVLAGTEMMMGFIPNSMLTMAHQPPLTAAFSVLAGAVMGAPLEMLLENAAKADAPRQPSSVTPELRQLVALASSLASGCRYCQAHTSHNGHRAGASSEKLNDILRFETSPHFSGAERAAVALAFAAGAVPNEATPEHFEALSAHFSPAEITELVGVIALFGYLNRWNDTMATALEAPAFGTVGELDALEWSAGKHG